MRSKMRQQILWIPALLTCLSLSGSPATIAQNRTGHLGSLQAEASVQHVQVALAPEEPSWSLLDGSSVVTARIGTSVVFDSPTNQMIIFAGFDERGTLNDVAAVKNANGLGGAPIWDSLIGDGASGSPPRRSAISRSAPRARGGWASTSPTPTPRRSPPGCSSPRARWPGPTPSSSS